MNKPELITITYYDFIMVIFYIGYKHSIDLLHYPDENGKKHNFIQWVDFNIDLDENPLFDIKDIEQWTNVPLWAKDCIKLIEEEFGTEHLFWG